MGTHIIDLTLLHGHFESVSWRWDYPFSGTFSLRDSRCECSITDGVGPRQTGQRTDMGSMLVAL